MRSVPLNEIKGSGHAFGDQALSTEKYSGRKASQHQNQRPEIVVLVTCTIKQQQRQSSHVLKIEGTDYFVLMQRFATTLYM